MRVRRSMSVLIATIPLVVALAVPGVAAPERSPSSPWAPLSGPSADDADDIATSHLQAGKVKGLRGGDVADLVILSSYTSAHNGVTHVNLGQRYRNRDVFGAVATISVDDEGRILHLAETFERGLRVAGEVIDTSAVEAVESAADALDLPAPAAPRVTRRSVGAAQETVIVAPEVSDDPIPARLGWQPTSEGLRLAWDLVIDDATDVHLWNAAVDAETGELLAVEDWTISHSSDELDHLGRGADAASTSAAADAPSTHRPLEPVEDGSAYKVLEVPKESPNDGPLTVVENPADARFSPLGWHDTGSQQFTTTRGNNVHAYLDQDANNQPDPGQDVDGGAGLQFLFDADLREHAQAYREAAVTNLFYWNNVIHDVMYNYGFTEESGNFQQNKFGKANGTTVLEGDYVRAEAADGGGTNNANFSTPARGGTPRMQMYLWPGNQFGAQNLVTVGDTSFNAGWARFGPPATNDGLSGTLAVAGGNGCAVADYPQAAGAVVIAPNVTAGGGSCSNVARALAAEAAGAAALIIASTTGTGTAAGPILTGLQTQPVGIPAVSVTLANGDALRNLAGETATVAKNPDHRAIRDGDLENGIIIHEYGHGVSFRLTGGPGVNCLSGAEQMGEGWSDYLAISMLLDPELDDPERPRGMGPYALFQDTREGNGIRVQPYSRNMDINQVTYDNIRTGGWRGGSIAQPHGIGWVWASVLWDLTWDLIDRHGFHDNIYDAWDAGGNTRAIQYVMDGMKFQGCNPGFIDGRDGILAATAALGGEDTCMVWSAFARRGFGYSAEQGSSANRNDNTEAFDLPPACRAPGRGFVGPLVANADTGTLTVREAGSTLPLQFNLTGHPRNGRLDVLKPMHSPASQRIDCDTLLPFGGTNDPLENITTPGDTPGSSGLTYVRAQDRYQLNWQTSVEWAGTCRQLLLTTSDGTQHRANLRFVAAP